MPCKNMVKCEIPVNLRWVWYLWGKMDISNIYLIVLYSFMSWSVGCGHRRRQTRGSGKQSRNLRGPRNAGRVHHAGLHETPGWSGGKRHEWRERVHGKGKASQSK